MLITFIPIESMFQSSQRYVEGDKENHFFIWYYYTNNKKSQQDFYNTLLTYCLL